MSDRLSEEMADKMSATVGITRRKYIISYVYYNSFLYTISSLCSFHEGVELKHIIEFRTSNCNPFQLIHFESSKMIQTQQRTTRTFENMVNSCSAESNYLGYIPSGNPTAMENTML